MNRSVVIPVVTGLIAVAAGALVALWPAGPWRAPVDFFVPAPSSVAGPSTTTPTPVATTAAVPTTTVPTTTVPGTSTTTASTTPATTTTTTTTTTTATSTSGTSPTTPATTAAPPTPVDRASLTVVAVNANGVAGTAGAIASELVAVGYASVTPTDALERAATSVVYLRVGLDLEAARLVADLGWEGVALAPLDQLPAIEATGEFDLVVLIGLDRV